MLKKKPSQIERMREKIGRSRDRKTKGKPWHYDFQYFRTNLIKLWPRKILEIFDRGRKLK